jgi:hypothetical protein
MKKMWFLKQHMLDKMDHGYPPSFEVLHIFTIWLEYVS